MATNFTFVTLTLVVLLPGVVSAQDARMEVDLRAGVLTVDIDQAPRALEYAIYRLRRICECPISFEEPELTYPGDFDEKVLNDGRTMRTPKKTSLSLSRSVSVPLARDEVASILNELIALDAAENPGQRFQVIERRVLEVRPLSARDADGHERPASSLLDTPISLERDTANPGVWLYRIAAALQLTVNRSVMGTYAPNAPLINRMVTLEANGEPARDVLDRMLSQLPRQGYWTFSYTPELDQFHVGVRYGPDPAQ